MKEPADLEIGLNRSTDSTYAVSLRYSNPEDTEMRGAVIGIASFDFEELANPLIEQKDYGQLLTKQLFSDQHVRDYFNEVRVDAEKSERPLRIRLALDPGDPYLHDLRWETLEDLRDGTWLLTNERIYFSRFLQSTSSSWERIKLRSRGELRALVVIANPVELEQGHFRAGGRALTPVNVTGEIKRAESSLAGLETIFLVSDPNQPGNVDVPHILENLRQGYDIFYLVCHGALLTMDNLTRPFLLLDVPGGEENQFVPGEQLAIAIKDLPPDKRPRLVVLASCESAGQGQGPSLDEEQTADIQGALKAVGPLMARYGVPAVVAMQGSVTMQTVDQFAPRFFSELLKDGEIDRAMAVARGEVRQREDAWMPLLYSRLRGNLWYVPGFGGNVDTQDLWISLKDSVDDNLCTPIIGSGFYASVFGEQREIAADWSREFNYPLRQNEVESLPQVAQFLATKYRGKEYRALEKSLKNNLATHYPEELSEFTQDLESADLEEMVDVVGKVNRLRNPYDPYKVLATMPLKVYITTNANNLLASALQAVNRSPEVIVCPWNDFVVQKELYQVKDPDYWPSVERPLVFHMFGRLDERKSVVLTEDDFFDFLIGVSRNKSLIHESVLQAWSKSALLFMGFQLDDWDFRVIFRSILAQAGGALLGEYSHIAVQIEPDVELFMKPADARDYLETYFSKSYYSKVPTLAVFNLYWGNVDDFLQELANNLKLDVKESQDVIPT